MWREQKQLWEACLHWPAVTVTVEGASKSSPGAPVEGKAGTCSQEIFCFRLHTLSFVPCEFADVVIKSFSKYLAFSTGKVVSAVSLFSLWAFF